uniref:Uncharacterized protein n=1 Tax=Acrobeloides nanus TaxID=290746 RepID=A0A914CNA0_9BILA
MKEAYESIKEANVIHNSQSKTSASLKNNTKKISKNDKTSTVYQSIEAKLKIHLELIVMTVLFIVFIYSSYFNMQSRTNEPIKSWIFVGLLVIHVGLVMIPFISNELYSETLTKFLWPVLYFIVSGLFGNGIFIGVAKENG